MEKGPEEKSLLTWVPKQTVTFLMHNKPFFVLDGDAKTIWCDPEVDMNEAAKRFCEILGLKTIYNELQKDKE